ncbi:MAG: hypothetical protein ACKO91_07975 [Acidimicrobiales bacterium]
MNGAKHPFTGWLYERDGDGIVKVTATDGREGWFDLDGRWQRGSLRECDPQVCHWVGGPTYTNHRLSSATPSASN